MPRDRVSTELEGRSGLLGLDVARRVHNEEAPTTAREGELTGKLVQEPEVHVPGERQAWLDESPVREEELLTRVNGGIVRAAGGSCREHLGPRRRSSTASASAYPAEPGRSSTEAHYWIPAARNST